MSHVYHRYHLDLYVDALVGVILQEMAWSRWSIVHEGRFSMGEMSYEEFVANFAYIVPIEYLEHTREDYLFLRELIMKHWSDSDFADIHHPPVFDIVGNFYVFEFTFERP